MLTFSRKKYRTVVLIDGRLWIRQKETIIVSIYEILTVSIFWVVLEFLGYTAKS